MPESATPVVYATRSGGTTLDQDAEGGNPFASALIALANRPGTALGALLPALRAETLARSGGHQTPQWSQRPAQTAWRFAPAPAAARERRIALVLVVAEYAALANPRLAGAAHDQRRVAAMLAGHGFSVVQGVAPERAALLRALRDFAAQSRRHDTAWVYSTGHGIEAAGTAFLIPGDYPFERGYGAAVLRRHAVAVPRIAAACAAGALNLAFFAGCRTHAEGGAPTAPA